MCVFTYLRVFPQLVAALREFSYVGHLWSPFLLEILRGGRYVIAASLTFGLRSSLRSAGPMLCCPRWCSQDAEQDECELPLLVYRDAVMPRCAFSKRMLLCRWFSLDCCLAPGVHGYPCSVCRALWTRPLAVSLRSVKLTGYAALLV